MNIVILGAGGTGAYAAAALSQEEHNVILIDSDAKRLEKAARESDVATLHALDPSWKGFADLLDNRPDLFLAATREDAANLVACSVAKNLGFPKTVARVRQREYINHPRLDFKRLFFTDYLIGPELLSAQDLYKMLLFSHDIAADHFAHGAIQMRTIQIPKQWSREGTPIAKLSLPPEVMIGLIHRLDQTVIPHGNDVLMNLDQVTFIGEASAMRNLHEWLRIPHQEIRSVVIVGGSLVAIHLADLLCQQKIDVRFIEKDPDRCEELAERFPEATVLHRDGADLELLRSENVVHTDALISCTHSDETNLLIASLAKELKCPKVIAQITDRHIVPVLEKLQVLPALSAKVNLTNCVLKILNEKTTLSISSLCCDTVKIIEMRVAPSSKAVGIPLSDLSLPSGVLIAVIETQGGVVIGKGNSILCPNDIAIVICHPSYLPKLEQLFSG